MPGANCSIYGCSTSRKTKGIAIFRIPTGNDEYNTSWRNKIVAIITKDREIDSSLRKQIENKTLHTCELHYPEENLLRNEKKTTRIPGSLPVLNLPIKSFPLLKKERPTTSIDKRSTTSSASLSESKHCYITISEFVTRIKKLKLPSGWEIKEGLKFTSISFSDSEHAIAKIDILVETNLHFNILVYNWKIPENNEILSKYNSTMENITLSHLIFELSSKNICKGLNFTSASNMEHTVPKLFTADLCTPLSQTKFNRPIKCLVLCELEKCKVCFDKEKIHLRQEKIKACKQLEPVKANAPLLLTSPERLKQTVQQYRIENKDLKAQLSKLQAEIKKSSVPASESLNNDLKSIMSAADKSKISPFMKFFWEEQQKYLQSSSTGVRYHPSIIRYCLSLQAKSASAYEDLRYNQKTGTGFLILPSQRRLRDFKNYIHPKRGFNKEIIAELCTKVEKFSDAEKYVVLLLDEMKIQENLVWDKHTGELIGYIDLGDQELNQAAIENVESIATHVLVFMLRSIINPFKFSLANFGTTGATAAQIFPLFWKAVSICELRCKLKVLAVTCDGAGANRRFFKMHFTMMKDEDKNPEVGVIYFTQNLYSVEIRYIYFISDVPHLLKTARNCLYNSGAGKQTRYMWNNGYHVLWNHISKLFYEDQECGLHLLPKLTYDHIKLTSYSLMNVRLAAQVLSSNVGNVLQRYGSTDSQETARFCLLMDTFFDILNIRDSNEYQQKCKPNLKPFSSLDDPRLSWLTTDFLDYFRKWLNSINERPGEFSKTDQGKMFISDQTYEGLQITSHSLVACIKFLLSNQICQYVMTERFSQDPLENYFGRQRSIGFRKDNPTLRDVGYNDNSIRNTKIFRPIAAGNSGGVDKAVVELSDEPVPCRKKPKL